MIDETRFFRRISNLHISSSLSRHISHYIIGTVRDIRQNCECFLHSSGAFFLFTHQEEEEGQQQPRLSRLQDETHFDLWINVSFCQPSYRWHGSIHEEDNNKLILSGHEMNWRVTFRTWKGSLGNCNLQVMKRIWQIIC